MASMHSKAQWRALFAKENNGELKPGTAEDMAHKTKTPFKKLPGHIKMAAFVSAFMKQLKKK